MVLVSDRLLTWLLVCRKQYQEIQPVIERIVEKPKVVEVTQNVKEIIHE